MQGPMEWTLLGNAPMRWAVAAGVFVVSALLVRISIKVVLLRLESLARRTTTGIDDLLAEMLRKTRTLFILLIAFWVGSETLALPEALDRGMELVLVVGILTQAAFWGTAFVGYFIERYRQRQVEVDPGGATAIGAMSFIARTLVWSVAVLLILDNLDIDVTALITGLGIGGIAVALALQNVLSDLFASLSIVLDKPFAVGDFVVVGEFLGTVEYVGLKTTRLRSLSGEQIVFSNSDLLGSRIRNYKRMVERRASFQLGVTYDTPAAKLRAIPGIIQTVIEAQANTRFDRSHFRAYGPFSLDYETVYFMRIPDYNAYMDTQQAINLEIFNRFQEEGIDFAFPTQTVFVHEPRNSESGARNAMAG